MAKNIHPTMQEIKVSDIHGYEFSVYSTSTEDFKVETSHLSHPIYNPDKVQKKISIGRSDMIAKKMAKMQEAAQKSS